MIIFDSNIWISYLFVEDSLHDKAKVFFETRKVKVFIPEYVVGEVCSVLLIRSGKDLADQFLQMLTNNEDVRILYSSQSLFQSTVQLFQKLSTKQLSFIDTALLSLSQEYTVYTFDKNLEKAIKKLENS
jgi:predicted nucleic acid-binding protein